MPSYLRRTKTRTLGSLIVSLIALCCPIHALADEAPPPPYVLSKANGVVIGVTWESKAVREALPKGISDFSSAWHHFPTCGIGNTTISFLVRLKPG